MSGTPLIVKGIVYLPVRIAGTLLKPDRRHLSAISDKVWLHNPVVKPGLTRKLTSPWVGPFEVIDAYPNLVNYKVHPLDKLGRRVNNAKSRLVHVGRLKRYFSPDVSEIRLSDVSRP
jgi:hypothetical protein